VPILGNTRLPVGPWVPFLEFVHSQIHGISLKQRDRLQYCEHSGLTID